MVRPCFLVVDREFPGSISTRKLVIETAKYNVLTAYSGQEALETFKTFPAVHGIVIDSELRDMPGETPTKGLKAIKGDIPVIAICGPGQDPCPSADFELQSFDPKRLLELLGSLMPAVAKAIEKHEEDLERSK